MRRRGSDFFFAYANRIGALVTEEYTSERERHARPTEQARDSAVGALLSGRDANDRDLGDYPVAGFHIALVGAGRSVPGALGRVAKALDCRLLLLDVYPDPWWAWLGRRKPFEARTRRLLAAIGDPAPDQVGIGVEAAEASGFRESHRQAMTAFRATTKERPLILYREIALEDLATRDLEFAHAFMQVELGPLLGDDSRSARLRETLRCYFACGQNARTTAAQLGIHHQTVAQRLEAIEAQLHTPIATRRAELELALRLQRYLAQAEEPTRDP